MTKKKVDLPLQAESEKNYELIALFWQITGKFLCIKYSYAWYCINPKLMGRYGWLLVVTGDYWVVMGDSRF